MSERNSTPLPISGSRSGEGDLDRIDELVLGFDGAEELLRCLRVSLAYE